MKILPKILFITFAVFSLNSCALRPITSQYDYQKNNIENVRLDNLGNGRILIYNDADVLHKMDNTARLNMWIDEKPMGQIRANEFAIIELEKGTYEIKLLHVDIFKFKSTHTATIDESTRVIRIEPTLASNDLNITNQLPSGLDNLKYVESR